MPDTVEDMCPEIPRLDGLMKDINDLSESGARYTEMPHVIEVVLPMLCNYLSYWWERGPESQAAILKGGAGPICSTTVTSEHLSVILGNILKILNSNLGIDEASWMKRIAGEQKMVMWGAQLHIVLQAPSLATGTQPQVQPQVRFVTQILISLPHLFYY